MCYKDEVQRKNTEKLQRKLNEDNVPGFIRDYLEDIESKSGALNYWAVIRDLNLIGLQNPDKIRFSYRRKSHE